MELISTANLTLNHTGGLYIGNNFYDVIERARNKMRGKLTRKNREHSTGVLNTIKTKWNLNKIKLNNKIMSIKEHINNLVYFVLKPEKKKPFITPPQPVIIDVPLSADPGPVVSNPECENERTDKKTIVTLNSIVKPAKIESSNSFIFKYKLKLNLKHLLDIEICHFNYHRNPFVYICQYNYM